MKRPTRPAITAIALLVIPGAAHSQVREMERVKKKLGL